MTLESVFSLFSLLFISLGTSVIARRLRVPYTVLLVLVGTMIVLFAHIGAFSFIEAFKLTPELLFYIFLPILIFESAYNMKIRDLQANIHAISWLSVVSLLISMFVIAFGLYGVLFLFHLQVPFLVTLLFGALISATDPVAVLALFKEFGVPRRLALIFEGESLFNDGTSFAAFLIVLEILIKGYSGPETLFAGIVSFAVMVFGGIAFGLFMGFLFAKLIEKTENNEHVEITLTMLVAHLTFILSEVISHHLVVFGFEFKLSAIIATVMASMVIGNYGRSKLSHRTAHVMEQIWGYFAFLANSLVFITMGLLFANLPIRFSLFVLPIILTVAIVVAARALSIYPVAAFLNWRKKEDQIPLTWQHLLAWGSLRGALAVTMVLLIPNDISIPGWQYGFTIKEFITALTIGCIYFTLLVKATSIGGMIKRFRLDMLSPLEQAEYHQSRALIYSYAINRIEGFHNKGYLRETTYAQLRQNCSSERDQEYGYCESILKQSPHEFEYALRVYALGIEEYFLGLLFKYHEVPESVYKRIFGKLSVQLGRVEAGSQQLQALDEHFEPDWFEQIALWIGSYYKKKPTPSNQFHERYTYYRAQEIIARKVVKELLGLKSQSIMESSDYYKAIDSVAEQYKAFQLDAQSHTERLTKENRSQVDEINDAFGTQSMAKALEEGLNELGRKGMLSSKLAIVLDEEFSPH